MFSSHVLINTFTHTHTHTSPIGSFVGIALSIDKFEKD